MAARILLIDDCREWGGAEVCFANYARALARDNRISVLVDKQADPRINELSPSRIRIPSYGKGFASAIGIIRNSGTLLSCAARILLHAARFRPDVILCNDHLALLHTLPTRLLRRTPVIFAAHNTELIQENARYRKLLFQADAVLAVGPSVCEQFAGYNGVIRVIHSPVKEPEPAAAQAPAGRPRFVCVARLCAQKRQDALLRGFALIRHETDAVLELYGDGEWRSLLEQLAVELGISDRVVFKGFTANPWTHAQGALAFCLVSDNEGAPLSVAEAQLAGVPVLGRALPSIRDMVTDGETGCLIANNAQETMAAGLRRILRMPTDERERLLQNAKAAAKARHAPEIFARELNSFVSQIAQQGIRRHAST